MQLLMVLKEYELPSRGLFGGKVFEMADRFVCKCGKKSLIAVFKAKGRIRPLSCPNCKEKASRTAQGWFNSYRFVLINDPDFEGKDVPALFEDGRPKVMGE